MSSSQKYVLVDHWMLFKRAQEEVKLLKGEMKQHIAYLVSTRSVLSKNQVFNNGASKLDDFLVGKSLLSACEITRLDVKIRECLKKFRLYSEFDFQQFTLNDQIETESTVDSSESDASENSDDSFYDESSETENSDEIGEESNTESDMSFDWSDSD